MRTLDVFGPLEVFGDANRSRSEGPTYEISVISGGTDRDVPTHLGTTLRTDRTYGEYRDPVDTLLVAGFDGVSTVRYEPKFRSWLKDRCGSSRRFGSVCPRALVLAEAGLLDGRRATTHWNWCEELARDYPRVTVDPTPIYVRDGNRYTSAGVTAGIDLALALVEEDLGRSVALKAAQMMVVFLRRPAAQSQFSATLMAQISAKSPLNDLLAWLPDNIRRNLSVKSLAQRAVMSSRNFARLFQQEVGRTPARYIEDLRLEAVALLLLRYFAAHSSAAYFLFGDESPQFSGCVAYRGVVPADRLAHLKLSVEFQIWMGPHKHLVHYFVRSGRMVNFVALVEKLDCRVASGIRHSAGCIVCCLASRAVFYLAGWALAMTMSTSLSWRFAASQRRSLHKKLLSLPEADRRRQHLFASRRSFFRTALRLLPGPGCENPHRAWRGRRPVEMTRLNTIERGDPQATSEAILKLVDTENPPLRLGLGTTILSRARAAYAERIATWEAWEDVANAAMGQPKILGTL